MRTRAIKREMIQNCTMSHTIKIYSIPLRDARNGSGEATRSKICRVVASVNRKSKNKRIYHVHDSYSVQKKYITTYIKLIRVTCIKNRITGRGYLLNNTTSLSVKRRGRIPLRYKETKPIAVTISASDH